MHTNGVCPLSPASRPRWAALSKLSVSSHCISQLTDCARLFTYLSDIGEFYMITEKRRYIRSSKAFPCRW